MLKAVFGNCRFLGMDPSGTKDKNAEQHNFLKVHQVSHFLNFRKVYFLDGCVTFQGFKVIVIGII
ncbi:hypothetical protein D3C87_2102610 [compost metagenome]